MRIKLLLKYPLFMVLILIFILFFNCFGHTAIKAGKYINALQSRKLVLFIINFDIIMCSPCLNPFLDFYHLLPSAFRENMVWGIIIYENPKEEENKEIYAKIVEKKLRGFIKANNIKCPIVLDHFHSLEGFSKKGTTILLFDQGKKIVKKYIFPLTKKQIKEVLNFLEN